MKILTAFLTLLLMVGVAYSEDHMTSEEPKDEDKPEISCPITRYTDNNRCSDCHTMVMENGKAKFGLKEVRLDSAHSAKPYCMEVVEEDGQLVAYLLVTEIDKSTSEKFREISQYLYRHPEFKKFVMEIHSPGGSVMSAWRIIGIIEEMRSHGIMVETRCYGMAASAGGILLIAGDVGHRYVSPHAEIMMHKVWQFSMFDVADPDSSEDKTNILKHFQENINKFFEERTNLKEDFINEKTYHKMYWFTGREAIKHKVADHLISG